MTYLGRFLFAVSLFLALSLVRCVITAVCGGVAHVHGDGACASLWLLFLLALFLCALGVHFLCLALALLLCFVVGCSCLGTLEL